MTSMITCAGTCNIPGIVTLSNWSKEHGTRLKALNMRWRTRPLPEPEFSLSHAWLVLVNENCALRPPRLSHFVLSSCGGGEPTSPNYPENTIQIVMLSNKPLFLALIFLFIKLINTVNLFIRYTDSTLGVCVRGAFHKFKVLWPQTVEHSHDDPDREVRYRVGNERMQALKDNAEPFAYSYEEGVEYVAFLNELDEADIDYRMTPGTRYEYVCGRISGEDVLVFSYIWFDSVSKAKEYAVKHEMTIEGGWNDRF